MLAYELVQKCWSGWKLGEKLGEGSFGEVYEIVDPVNPESGSYALKIIRYPQSDTRANTEGMGLSTLEDLKEYYRPVMQNLINEIRIMERLRTSGNIVVLYEYKIIEEHNPFCWNIALRMEKLESLTDYKKRHTLTEKEILDLGIDISKAIAICHESNIIHRDIKESNIFRSPHGSYKIGDFGISKHIENTQASLSHKGTLNYMAPEIYRGERYGYNVDTYALGLVLYRLLNRGRIPFLPPEGKLNARLVEEANDRRLNGETLPPPVDGSLGLITIIEKACHPDPKKRYASAEEMKEDLILQRYAQRYAEKLQSSISGHQPAQTDARIEADDKTQVDGRTLNSANTASSDRIQKTEAMPRSNGQTPPPTQAKNNVEATKTDYRSTETETAQNRGDENQWVASSQWDDYWYEYWYGHLNNDNPTKKPKAKNNVKATKTDYGSTGAETAQNRGDENQWVASSQWDDYWYEYWYGHLNNDNPTKKPKAKNNVKATKTDYGSTGTETSQNRGVESQWRPSLQWDDLSDTLKGAIYMGILVIVFFAILMSSEI